MAVDDVYRVRTVCIAAAQIGVNVLHYRTFAETGVGATRQEIATFLDARWHQEYKDLLSVHASYRGAGVTKVRPPPVSEEQTSIVNAGPGLVAGDILPKQVSGLLGTKTAFSGPGFRGRTYVPFPGETDSLADGAPSVGYIAMLGDLSIQINQDAVVVGAGGTTSLQFGVYRRVADAFNPATTMSGRIRWATQRRRGDYGKTNISPF